MLILPEKPFHIPAERGKIGEYCLLPGAPERVEMIAKRLENPVFVGTNREFTIWNGTINGELVTVCSTGIGGPSAAIAAEELANCGARVLIRVGTCGGIEQSVKSGDLVIASGAVRQDGTSREYAPIEYPAVPDYRVLFALVSAAANGGAPYHVGVVQSKDSFYGQHDPDRMPVAEKLNEQWTAWKRLGVLASEMESSTLFTVGAARGLLTGAIFHTLWNQERVAAGLDSTEIKYIDIASAITVAVEAVRILIEQKK